MITDIKFHPINILRISNRAKWIITSITKNISNEPALLFLVLIPVPRNEGSGEPV